MRRTTVWAWMLTLGLVACDTTPPPPPPGAEDAELNLEIESGGGDMSESEGEPASEPAKEEGEKPEESK